MPAPIDFANLFVRPPGDVLYFLIVAALLQSIVALAYGAWRQRGEDGVDDRRLFIGAVASVVVWLLLVIGAVYVRISDQPSEAILPPLERAVSAASIVLLGWSLLTTQKRLSIGVLLLLLAICLGYLVTGTQWASLYTRMDFNASFYGAAWTFGVSLLLIGICGLSIARFGQIADAPLKLLVALVLLVGHVVTLTAMARGTLTGDYPGMIRISIAIAFALIALIAHRALIGGYRQRLETTAERSPASAPPAPRVVASQSMSAIRSDRGSAQLMKALGDMIEGATPQTLPRQIVLAALDSLHADVGLLLEIGSPNHLDIVWGFDRGLDHPLTSLSIRLDRQPTLLNAIERRAGRALLLSDKLDELSELYDALDIRSVGPTYIQPLTSGDRLYGMLLIGSPYSKRELIDSERELFHGIAIISAKLLTLSVSDRDARARADRVIATAARQRDEGFPLLDDDLRQTLEEAQRVHDGVQGDYDRLRREVDLEWGRLRVARMLTSDDRSNPLVALRDDMRQLVQSLDQVLPEVRALALLQAAIAPENDMRIFIDAIGQHTDRLRGIGTLLLQERDVVRDGVLSPMYDDDLLERLIGLTAAYRESLGALQTLADAGRERLTAFGIEPRAPQFLTIMARLYSDRFAAYMRIDALDAERGALTAQLVESQALVSAEAERARQVEVMQKEIARLASDREAADRQRDALVQERTELVNALALLEDRQRQSLAEITALEHELNEVIDDRRTFQALLQSGNNNANGAQIVDLIQQRDALARQLREARTAAERAAEQIESLRAQEDFTNDSVVYRPDNPELFVNLIQELRSPMTSIIGYIDLLLNEAAGILGDMQRKFLQRAQTNVVRLASLLDDLSRITFHDGERFSIAPSPVDAVAVIDDALTLLAGQMRQRSVSVQLQIADRLPPVSIERDALQQIVGHLLTNAVYASFPGGLIHLEVAVARPEGHHLPRLSIAVSDQGGGIAEDQQPRVFSRKYQSQNAIVSGIGDTGVGLAIAKALVESQGGTISFETEVGVGSTFKVMLPLVISSDPEEERSHAP